jgi:hypothetical protein
MAKKNDQTPDATENSAQGDHDQQQGQQGDPDQTNANASTDQASGANGSGDLSGQNGAPPDQGGGSNGAGGMPGDPSQSATDTGSQAGADNASTDGDAEKEKTGKKGGRKANADSADPFPDDPIGAIRTHEGKEYVKVGPKDWRPTVRIDGDTPPDDGVRVKIKNKTMKGQKLFLGDGTLAEFDSDGIIEVSGKEAARLQGIPDYERV